jgi:hypothetical protein
MYHGSFGALPRYFLFQVIPKLKDPILCSTVQLIPLKK